MISGYFAYRQQPWRRSKVHMVKDGKPICNVKIADHSEFLWTNTTVECLKCRRILERESKTSKKVKK